MIMKVPTGLLFLSLAAREVSCYFLITQPSRDSPWQNGTTNSLTWTKGDLDGITEFDFEIARLNSDGLILVARDVPTSAKSLDVYLRDVPTAEDYFILFVNSTSGHVLATSEKFSILPSTATIPLSNTTAKSDLSVPTVTIPGPPNPTQGWLTTFPAMVGKANSARGLHTGFGGGKGLTGLPILMTVLGCLLGMALFD